MESFKVTKQSIINKFIKDGFFIFMVVALIALSLTEFDNWEENLFWLVLTVGSLIGATLWGTLKFYKDIKVHNITLSPEGLEFTRHNATSTLAWEKVQHVHVETYDDKTVKSIVLETVDDIKIDLKRYKDLDAIYLSLKKYLDEGIFII
jgi:hypothetical protein